MQLCACCRVWPLQCCGAMEGRRARWSCTKGLCVGWQRQCHDSWAGLWTARMGSHMRRARRGDVVWDGQRGRVRLWPLCAVLCVAARSSVPLIGAMHLQLLQGGRTGCACHASWRGCLWPDRNLSVRAPRSAAADVRFHILELACQRFVGSRCLTGSRTFVVFRFLCLNGVKVEHVGASCSSISACERRTAASRCARERTAVLRHEAICEYVACSRQKIRSPARQAAACVVPGKKAVCSTASKRQTRECQGAGTAAAVL